MKTKHRYISLSLILLILTLSGLFGIATAAHAQEVHALLIILGNDENIRNLADNNKFQIVSLMRKVSELCKVHVTVMESSIKESEANPIGTVTYTPFSNGKSTGSTTQEQGAITTQQVVQWIQELQPNADDIVLIYYSGRSFWVQPGVDKQYLSFGTSPTDDRIRRDKLAEHLRQKPGRLKLLITDTCVFEIQSPRGYTSIQPLRLSRSAIKNLFLEHEGFLDITAASPGQFAIGSNRLGGHFTEALISHSFTATADTDKDNFFSWQEAFDETAAGTMALYQAASFDWQMRRNLEAIGQKIQKPYVYSLPKPIGGDGSTRPSIPIAATAILNLTSVPSGAEVVIDGSVVGKTPLNGYKPETDGRTTKEIKVTIKATGYEDSVKTLRVLRGKPFDWEFELTKKATDIPKTIIGQDGAEMVLIPAGEFQMGTPGGPGREQPVHTVYVDAFYMDTYPVTNAQYKKFVDANPQWQKRHTPGWFRDGNYLKHWNRNNYPSGKADHPVVHVSWYAAMAYAKWAGKRLPTEAEWERAARGGLSGKRYPWGDTIDDNKANYNEKVGNTTPVNSYAPNGYGLYDMSGNVFEWCLDGYYQGFYEVSPRQNPISGGSITDITDNYKNVKGLRILRGGSWNYPPRFARVAYRYAESPADSNGLNGFRCVKPVAP